MSEKLMLIDQSYGLETRVAIIKGALLEDFDYELVPNKLKKGNIYLAKVARVEPSLQAVFIDYGQEKHGFLAFAEIHPEYYQLDKKASPSTEEVKTDAPLPEEAPDLEDEEEDFIPKPQPTYQIQDVIKRNQLLLVQVVKDARGTKGAAFTTYISLPGKYGVLMPNTPTGIGISRKITDTKDRESLKKIVEGLQIPERMSLIVRTAGLGRTKSEIKKDYDYLSRLWSDMQAKILSAKAPALIYEESDLLTRALRDFYSTDIAEILIQGAEAYKKARAFMRMFMPSHVKRVHLYEDSAIPLFDKFGVEDQIKAIYHHTVPLPSGGAIVINQTEALVAVDVNSARSTREKHIEETALKTNLEAAAEIARQLKLRDLSGLIVIDFIDMPSHKHTQVERVLREALQHDRARLQIGKISSFGLLEMSRQRLRQSLFETNSLVCPYCVGSGRVLSLCALSLNCLRLLEAAESNSEGRLVAYGSGALISYLLNEQRALLSALEARRQVVVILKEDPNMHLEDFRLEIPEPLIPKKGKGSKAGEDVSVDQKADKKAENQKTERRRKKKANAKSPTPPLPAPEAEESLPTLETTPTEPPAPRKSRKRRTRHKKPSEARALQSAASEPQPEAENPMPAAPVAVEMPKNSDIIPLPEAKGGRRRKRTLPLAPSADNKEEPEATKEGRHKKRWWRKLKSALK